jgi:hypothetical protein
MLNTIFEKRLVIGYHLSELFEMLRINSVYSARDIALCPEISDISCDIMKQQEGCQTIYSENGMFLSPANELAKQFFDIELDEHFRSTITEARVYFALYKNFEEEIDDMYLKQSLLEMQDAVVLE